MVNIETIQQNGFIKGMIGNNITGKCRQQFYANNNHDLYFTLYNYYVYLTFNNNSKILYLMKALHFTLD